MKKPIPQEKPESVSDEDWKKVEQRQQEYFSMFEQQLIDNKFGKPLPFSKTPKGTVAVPWAQLDGKTTFEVDLPPKSRRRKV